MPSLPSPPAKYSALDDGPAIGVAIVIGLLGRLAEAGTGIVEGVVRVNEAGPAPPPGPLSKRGRLAGGKLWFGDGWTPLMGA